MDTNSLTLLFPLFLGGIFALLGNGFLIFGLRERNKAKETEIWPTAKGVIVSARLDHQTRTERNQGRTYTRTTYTPVVEYTYAVGENTYRGNRIFPGSSMSYDLGTAQNIVNHYQPGHSVSVHHDPTDPTQAVLETKSKGGSVFMIIGVVFTALGLIGCFFGAVMVLLSFS
jgi:hypothetical protein